MTHILIIILFIFITIVGLINIKSNLKSLKDPFYFIIYRIGTDKVKSSIVLKLNSFQISKESFIKKQIKLSLRTSEDVSLRSILIISIHRL